MRASSIVSALLVSVLVWGLAGCNTLEGLGKDLKQVGQSIENAADRKK